MVHSGLKGLYSYIKAKISMPSTQVVTSLSLVLATALLVITSSIGTKYISSNDKVDINTAQVKSTTARRDIGDAIDLSRIPDSTITKDQNSSLDTTTLDNTVITDIEHLPTSNSQKVNEDTTTTTTSTTTPIEDKKILSFSFTSYINSGSDHQIVFNWETNPIYFSHRILLKRTTNLNITNDDVEIKTYENNSESNFSDSLVYNDLGSEGIYMVLQYQNSSDDWVTQEYSNIAF